MDAERWSRLSPLLDALFELEPRARERRLNELRAEDKALAADLEALMALEQEQDDFLAKPCLPKDVEQRIRRMLKPPRLKVPAKS
ncbi:MAG: hypothetical protein KY442_07445 [Proteobacteria bacterium]|nr:hypothetical protein [Pseudomonadota bacterium]